ncbi:uncharacterized protein LOC112564977 isoform X2 [Pomacea canaliculata]|uniref:uncharacterized protein LOC112564977 isoform X2 n=1 Tax=Pomacea canaliculata TaxID=400727 RepID=UPI000D73631E|nr:uncharacterized protein LOC112564977 isoform X2 [Pomacea canaliculata]
MEDKHSWNQARMPSFKNLQAERQRKLQSLLHKRVSKPTQIPLFSEKTRPSTRSDSAWKEGTHQRPSTRSDSAWKEGTHQRPRTRSDSAWKEGTHQSPSTRSDSVGKEGTHQRPSTRSDSSWKEGTHERPCARSDSVGKEGTHQRPSIRFDSVGKEGRYQRLQWHERKRKSQSLDVNERSRTTSGQPSDNMRDFLKLPFLKSSEESRRSFEVRQLWIKAFNFVRISIRCAKYIKKRSEKRIQRSVKLKKSLMQAVLSQKVRKTWERAGRTLRFAFRIAKVMAIRSLEIELNLKTFTDLVYQEDQVYKKVGKPKKSLASNVKEATLTLKAQAIMLLPPSERTQEECSLVLCNLQFFDSFRMYPLDIQKNIVLRGHFIALPPGRVLIREGHVAQKWYLVISGQGLVRKTVQEDGPCKMTVDVLSQGMTFGESELEQETKRSFTVMSRQTLHLISLSKADYLFIFCKRMKTRNHNEHLDFLRNIHFMKYWPIERLRNRSFLCYQAYFKINDIVADNSREANAICIIRSGRCVLTMYVEATTASWRDLELTPPPLTETESMTEILKIQKNKWKKETTNEKEGEINHTDTKQIKKETKGKKQQRTRPLPSSRWNKTSSPPSAKPRSLYTISSDPVFIEIQTLSAGDVFGLENIKLSFIKEKQETCPGRLVLVSLGAEVILLSKSFYLAYWNESCQQQVLLNKPSYPTIEGAQTQYRRHLAWDLYTRKVKDELFEKFSNEGLKYPGLYFDTRYKFSSLQAPCVE